MKIKRYIYAIVLMLFSVCAVHAEDMPSALPSFHLQTYRDGLLSDQILTLTPMPDGGFIVRGDSVFSIVRNHKVVESFRCPKEMSINTAQYGSYVTLIDNHDHIWVKQCAGMWCFDLQHKSFDKLTDEHFDDVFVDHKGDAWMLSDSLLTNRYDTGQQPLVVRHGWEDICHLLSDSTNLYLVFKDGKLRCFDRKSCQMLYETRAFPEENRDDYSFSVVAEWGSDGNIYLVYSSVRSIFVRFNPSTKEWKQIIETKNERGFHCICLVDKNRAMVGCSTGVWVIDTEKGTMSLCPDLPLLNGDTLTTGINAVKLDGEGGIYLGTYGNGLLHADTLVPEESHAYYYIIGVLVLCLVVLMVSFYVNMQRRKRKEEELNLQIKELLSRSQSSEVPAEQASVDEQTDDVQELSEEDRQFMQRATALVEQNFSKRGYGVDDLARDMAMERTGLYRYLTRIINQAPSAFINGIRMERAAQMLLQNRETVTLIAENLGFSSASHFSRSFKIHFGCTPSEYVEAVKKGKVK